MGRNTTTGRVLELQVLPALERGGYTYSEQEKIGMKVNGRKHVIDILITKLQDADERILVSLKWQQTGGTAEQKVPFEIINLMHACNEYGFEKAYLILGGTDHEAGLSQTGWTLRKWYLERGLAEYINYEKSIKILLPDQFIALANSGKL